MSEQYESMPPPPQLPENTETPQPDAKKPLDQFLDHQRRALEESGKALEALLPAGFREHGDTARKEFIKGMKVLVDAAVVELEKASKEVDKAIKQARQGKPTPPPAADAGAADRPSTTGKTKVKVQVE